MSAISLSIYYVLGAVVTLGLSFALTRVASRLHQDIGLAALASLFFVWQGIALVAGAAALASAMTLLITAAVIVVLVQWVNHRVGVRTPIRIGLFLIAAAIWSVAATFPLLKMWQAIALPSSFALVIVGTWLAMNTRRNRVAVGFMGVPSVLLLAAWLALRLYATFT